MTEDELFSAVATRSGASRDEAAAVIRELFPQAFAMAAERGGTLAVPYFGTFYCRARAVGALERLCFRPRRPEELIRALDLRREKLGKRRRTARGASFSRLARLNGAPYIPGPVDPPEVGSNAGPEGG